VCALEEGNYTQASTLFQQSLHLHQATGDRRGESITLGNLGNVHLYVGAFAQAKAHYKRALHIQREIGARNDEALSVGNLGLVYHYLGDDAAARQCSYQALQIAQETGERRTEGAMWMKLGHALAGLGQFDGAAKAYQESVALRREKGWSNVTMEPLAGLARVALAQGDLAQAQAHVDEILRHMEGGDPSAPDLRPASRHALDGTISPFQVYLTCYRVLEVGQDPRARDVLATAYHLLQERAARITEKEMQRSFLEDVSPHRQIVRAFLELGETE